MSKNVGSSRKKRNRNHRQPTPAQQKGGIRNLVFFTGVAAVLLFMIVIMIRPGATSESAVEFPYDELPYLGKRDSPVKIVEFGDFKCPSCKVFSQEIVPLLKKDFIDTGIATLYFINYQFIGPDSITAGAAGEAVFRQSNDAFWSFYDAVYKNQGAERDIWATPDFLVQLAKSENIPVDYERLGRDIRSGEYTKEVEADNRLAKKSGVTGTPTLFINGRMFEDTFDYEKLKAAINEAKRVAEENAGK